MTTVCKRYGLYWSKTWNAVFPDSVYKPPRFISKNESYQGGIREVLKFSKPKICHSRTKEESSV